MPTTDVFHSQLDHPGDDDNDVEINSHDLQPKPVEKHEIHITERNPEALLPKKHANPPVEFTNATYIFANFTAGQPQGQKLVNAQHVWKRRITLRSIGGNVYVSPLPPVDTISNPVQTNPPGLIIKTADIPLELYYTGDLYFYFASAGPGSISILVEYCEQNDLNPGFI